MTGHRPRAETAVAVACARRPSNAEHGRMDGISARLIQPVPGGGIPVATSGARLVGRRSRSRPGTGNARRHVRGAYAGGEGPRPGHCATSPDWYGDASRSTLPLIVDYPGRSTVRSTPDTRGPQIGGRTRGPPATPSRQSRRAARADAARAEGRDELTTRRRLLREWVRCRRDGPVARTGSRRAWASRGSRVVRRPEGPTSWCAGRR